VPRNVFERRLDIPVRLVHQHSFSGSCRIVLHIPGRWKFVADFDRQPRRKRLLHLPELPLDLFENDGGICFGEYIENDGPGGLAIEVRVTVVVRRIHGCDLDFGNVFESQDLAIRCCPEEDIFKAFRILAARCVGVHILDGLRILTHLLERLADHVRAEHCLQDIVGSQAPGAHEIKIHPDTQDTLTAAKRHGGAINVKGTPLPKPRGRLLNERQHIFIFRHDLTPDIKAANERIVRERRKCRAKKTFQKYISKVSAIGLAPSG